MDMRICVPIREENQKKAVFKAKLARKKGADMVEIWLDEIRNLRVFELLKSVPRPVIAVCKPKKEKGSFKGLEKQRIALLAQAAAVGANYVDIDLCLAQKFKRSIKKMFRGAKVIVSYHDFKKTPGLQVLLKKAKAAFSSGADVAKIATKIRKSPENVILFELTSRLKTEKKNIIAVGMGKKGKISRLGCLSLGGYLTYASLDEKSKTAAGQLTLKECLFKSA